MVKKGTMFTIDAVVAASLALALLMISQSYISMLSENDEEILFTSFAIANDVITVMEKTGVFSAEDNVIFSNMSLMVPNNLEMSLVIKRYDQSLVLYNTSFINQPVPETNTVVGGERRIIQTGSGAIEGFDIITYSIYPRNNE